MSFSVAFSDISIMSQYALLYFADLTDSKPYLFFAMIQISFACISNASNGSSKCPALA